MGLDTELFGQCMQARCCVTAADDHREKILALQSDDDFAHRTQPAVHAVLRAHGADVPDQVLRAPREREVWIESLEGLRRAVAHDEDLVRPLAPARERHVPVRLVGGDDDVGHRVGASFHGPKHLIDEIGSRLPEPGEIGLGRQVVVVKHELLAEQLEHRTDHEQGVGWVRGVDHVEAFAHRHPERQQQHREGRIREFEGVADDSVSAGRRGETIDVDTVEVFAPGLTLCPRRDDGHVIACIAKRMRFAPHPHVERIRVVLDKQQDPSRRAHGIGLPRPDGHRKGERDPPVSGPHEAASPLRRTA